VSKDAAAAKLSDQPTSSLTVASIMISDVFTVTPQMSVREAIQLLVKNKISGAPVIDQGRSVISIVSEGDLLKLAAAIGLDKKIANGLDKLITADKIITAKKTDSFTDVYRSFLKNGVHRILVVDANFGLIGLVSRSNILKLLANEQG